METVYLGIIVFLFLLAIFDLVVGVSNDAVNFLNSAIGAKAASFRTIIIVAAIGIFCGATMSNGMMDIARHGIFQPEAFYFNELMCIFLAVMVTDVVLLDIFNTLGMPTSTTVSMVFELLGGTFALALVKIATGPDGLTFAELLNTEKALTVILAIFLSVAVAFTFGVLVQYISRVMFTFGYKSKLKWTIGIFGGIAVTSIIYFMLIQGLKDASFVTAENKTSRTTAALAGSRFPVGSSASTSLGLFTRARATATLCLSPPESWEGKCFILFSRLTWDSRLFALSRASFFFIPAIRAGSMTFSKAVKSFRR